MIYYAHSAAGETSPSQNWQTLRDHLRGVAELAKKLAVATQVPELAEAAEAAGWLHDLGKYRKSFQEFIRGRSPMGSKQHKEAGAAVGKKVNHLPLAFAILGHHGGIPDPGDMKNAIAGMDGEKLLPEIAEIYQQDSPEIGKLNIPRMDANPHSELFTRLLLSCLVDADWTDTSEHDRSIRNWPEFPTAPELNATQKLQVLMQFIEARAAINREKNPGLADIRKSILDACLASADLPKGLFTLTVPTGGGKTLSGLAFALKHAEKHSLRRVIYVAPYISILEQNANVIRDSLGLKDSDLDLFEHQSLAEPQGPRLPDEKQTSAAVRRAENWDSPIIVTTNVQFFESLFSNKPGRCRKLHNIAGSVVILDECQTLPPDLVKPTCQMLKQVVLELGCSVVLCTATQPAFDHEKLDKHRLNAREIIPEELQLFDKLKRVQLEWPKNSGETLTWSEVAARMTKNSSALCIVNTKKAALNLFEILKTLSQNVYHLSTSMCPAHRVAVLAKVKELLDANQKVFVVSTQLIEAGVDIDFPCVFREMAPLESIIQAAGRCNREGLIPEAGGRVIVFRSEDGKIPPGWYTKGRDVLQTILADNKLPSVDNPDDIREYFGQLYWKGELDPHNIVGMRAGFKFESIPQKYKLINEDTVPVVVATWKEHETEIEKLLTRVKDRPSRANFRALAPYQVNVFRHQWESIQQHVEQWEDLDVRVWRGKYEPDLGLVAEGPDELIV